MPRRWHEPDCLLNPFAGKIETRNADLDSLRKIIVIRVGLEPTTPSLKGMCSTC